MSACVLCRIYGFLLIGEVDDHEGGSGPGLCGFSVCSQDMENSTVAN